MSQAKLSTASRTIVRDVLGPDMTREIWTGNYGKALPVSVQFFDLTAILPAVFYMFRFGQRRGKGKFFQVFGSSTGTRQESRAAATIDHIAAEITRDDRFSGFVGEVGQAILGDLLLCFCLENRRRALGRTEPVQRVAPAHYMASWIDLPWDVVNLRHVPEMIVAMLTNQNGEFVEGNKDGDRTWFSVGCGFEENILLRAFHRGIKKSGELGSRTSDRFIEESKVGLDQLLMIGVAQHLGSAPEKLRSGEGERISNQRPIAEKAGGQFSEDIRRFIRSYADVIPRHAFVQMLESCMAVGLTTIITSVADLLFNWAFSGSICERGDQKPAFLFVDCSNGVDRRLRTLSEQSIEDYIRRLERLPVIFMALRLLDRGARYDAKIKNLNTPSRPLATKWINMLGDLLKGRRDESTAILYEMDRRSEELSEKLEKDYPEAAMILSNRKSQPNPVWRLSEALTALRGRSNTQTQLLWLFESALLMGYSNGLGAKRSSRKQVVPNKNPQKRIVRSLVLSDAVLDYLVHLHVLKAGNSEGVRILSLQDFIQRMHSRYGFCVDAAPPGMTISNELLLTNRSILERRLRDLGLLVGVNDAEAMKRLQPRFKPNKEANNDLE